jgi:multiple sugar transport system permease protein
MVTIFVLPITMMGQLKVFGPINIMTSGGLGTSSFVLNQYIYTTGFANFQFGLAAAA